MSWDRTKKLLHCDLIRSLIPIKFVDASNTAYYMLSGEHQFLDLTCCPILEKGRSREELWNADWSQGLMLMPRTACLYITTDVELASLRRPSDHSMALVAPLLHSGAEADIYP